MLLTYYQISGKSIIRIMTVQFILKLAVALGVKASSRYLFYIILSPVGPYYPEGFTPTRIYVPQEYVRAAKGGVGECKTSCNYAASLYAATRAQERGFTQVLWLDAIEHKYCEGVDTSNIFFLINDELITPPLSGSILPGITWDPVMHLAGDQGLNIMKRQISKGDKAWQIVFDICKQYNVILVATDLTSVKWTNRLQ